MVAITQNDVLVNDKKSNVLAMCYHCGTPCITNNISVGDKVFCCDGCQLVFEILSNNGLCDYYKIQSHPGLSQIKGIRSDKFAYLDNEDIAKQLYKFTNGDYTIVTFYVPGVHCSSCMWLLEHLSKISGGIVESRLNFTTKEVTIHFSKTKISLRKITELLATIGYEPYISLEQTNKSKTKNLSKERIYRLGVAGFCFGNIMMMSFPEYLSSKIGIEQQYAYLFRYLNLLLSLPVFFYSANEFFDTGWKGLKQKTLNIDAPIALAILITFLRSVYEITTNHGGGYLDSMSGIVFFMLVGRVVQERTYKSISFHRDYKSYFPIAVNVVTPTGVESRRLQDLKEKDVVQLYNDEIIPTDAVLIKGNALIDYSFVTGESEPVKVKQNEMVYAGGKQVGEQITIQILKPVASSYLTSLWNHYAFSKSKEESNDQKSVIHLISRYFTYILLTLALGTAIYWSVFDSSKVLTSVTAMLIVACPCALLLCATFTNGNLLRIFSDNGLFLRDATVIEQLGKINHIVFDKTGTITQSGNTQIVCSGHQLTEDEKNLVYSVIRHSQHPYSKAVATWIGNRELIQTTDWKENIGKGVSAIVEGKSVMVGSAEFINIASPQSVDSKSSVYVKLNDKVSLIDIRPMFRDAIPKIIPELRNKFKLSLLSGDNNKQQQSLSTLFGDNCELLFEQKPIDKLNYIDTLQKDKGHVLMIGDGLNDAGALQQSNVGITLADDINNFTPSCDAILDSKRFEKLPSLLKLAKVSKNIIGIGFIISIVYNIAGLYFAMQGLMRPILAAILMPCSTLSIVIISTGVSSIVASSYKLSLRAETAS